MQKIQVKKIYLNGEILAFCADFALSKNFNPRMLDEVDKSKVKLHPNLLNSSRFLASRVLKFYALNEFLSQNLKDKAKSVYFCLSHSKNVVALALAPFKIGFDIETIKQRNVNACLDFCFNDSEKARVFARSGENLDEFYRIFTAKEALLKLNDLQFSDFDKVGYDENGVWFDLKTFKSQNVTLKYHKFNLCGQKFLCCCAFENTF